MDLKGYSAQSIDAPGRDQIELFAGDGLQQLIEPWALIPALGAGRTRSHSRKGPGRPLGSPDHGYDGETVSPFPQSNSQTSAGIFSSC